MKKNPKKEEELPANWNSEERKLFQSLAQRFSANFKKTVLGCEKITTGGGLLLCRWMTTGEERLGEEEEWKNTQQVIQSCPEELFQHLVGYAKDWQQLETPGEKEAYVKGIRFSMELPMPFSWSLDNAARAARWVFLVLFERWRTTSNELTKLPR